MSVSPTDSSAIQTRTPHQPFQCPICQCRFTRHENLKRHAALHSRSQDEPSLTCDFCDATFSRSDLRHRHMKRKHLGHDDKEKEKRTRRRPQRTSTQRSHGGSPQGELPAASVMEVDAAAIWHSAPSSIDEDDAQIIAKGSMPTDLDSSLLMGTSYFEGNNNFNTQSVPINISQPGPFNANGTGYSYDHSITDSLFSLDLPQFQDNWYPTASQIAYGCHLFFANVSHFVPFLHQPTFDASQIPNHLLLSMLALAYQYGEDPELGHQAGAGTGLSTRCFNRARSLIASEEESPDDWSKNVTRVQSYLLLQIYSMLYLCGDDSAYGLKTHSKMISLARSGGLMQPLSNDSAATSDLDSLWRHFIKSESHKRTLLTVHQIDAQWYQFLSIPRSLSHLEIKHDLPCAEDYWTASSSIEWAHRRLVAGHSGASMRYTDAVRLFLSSDADFTSIPTFDPYGAINITQFLVSSAREVSGWSTMTGRLSMERLEPLKSSLLALSPFILSQSETTKSTSTALCEATWETAMIEMQMWSPSHTGGIVEGSIDAVLHQLTYLAPSYEFLVESNVGKNIQPHVDWFLRYLETTLVPDSEAPWVTLYAYKAFILAWQLVRGGMQGAMQVVGVQDGDVEGALTWAKQVFQRRQRWQLGKIIMSCLDELVK